MLLVALPIVLGFLIGVMLFGQNPNGLQSDGDSTDNAETGGALPSSAYTDSGVSQPGIVHGPTTSPGEQPETQVPPLATSMTSQQTFEPGNSIPPILGKTTSPLTLPISGESTTVLSAFESPVGMVLCRPDIASRFYAEVLYDGLKVRVSPDYHSKSIQSLSKGTKVYVVTEADEDKDWVEIRIGDIRGWIVGSEASVKFGTCVSD